ncbi:hypothetical protein VP01_147g12 [Puccinia sorghi]|uniref:Uncharacterized protein n=1 Tax=Puccinia sorghi TaxID=27349 RepID=A0A0L6VLF5_9BASI|nr:hypothetical protein VP01_147g12 [Puccinia sorghi]
MRSRIRSELRGFRRCSCQLRRSRVPRGVPTQNHPLSSQFAMWVSTWCTLVAAATTLSASFPLPIPPTRYQATININQLGWHSRLIQRRSLSRRGTSNPATTIDEPLASPLLFDQAAPLGTLHRSPPLSDSSPSSSLTFQPLVNPPSGHSAQSSSLNKPQPTIHTHPLQIGSPRTQPPANPPPLPQHRPSKSSNSPKPNIPSVTDNSAKNPLSLHQISQTLEDSQWEDPVQKQSQSHGPISSPPPGIEPPPNNKIKWLHKVREFWDKFLNKIHKWFCISPKKGELRSINLQKPSTAGTTTDDIHTGQPSRTSEDVRTEPTGSSADIARLLNVSHPVNHFTTGAKLLFNNSFSAPLIFLLPIRTAPESAPLDKPIPPSNSPPEHKPLSVSLPPTSAQTSHAGSQQALPGNQVASVKVVASQPEDSQPTPEVRIVTELLKHVDIEELAQCIHQNFRESGVQLFILSHLISPREIEVILLNYRRIITEKLKEMLAAQNINKFFLEQMASFLENWSLGVVASHLHSDIKASLEK